MRANTAPTKSKSKQFFKYDPITSVILLALVFFSSQVIAAVVTSVYPSLRNWTEADGKAWLADSVQSQFAFVTLVAIVSISAILRLIEMAKVKRSQLGLVPVRLRDIGWAFIAYGLYFLCFLVVISIAKVLVPALDLQQEQQTGFETAFSSTEILMTFLSLVVLVPLAEEIMFRGFLFSSLRAKFRFRYAVIITSVLFSVGHLQFGAGAPLLWVAAIDTLILSAFLCYIRDRSGSIWPAVFLHAIKNCLAFMVLFGSRLIY